MGEFSATPSHQKWWGWGHEGVDYDLGAKPKLLPWMEETIGVSEKRLEKPVQFGEVKLPQLNFPQGLKEKLHDIFGPKYVDSSNEARVLHAFGKSYRDLLRVRQGRVDSAPDAVVYPQSHEQVVALVRLSLSEKMHLIPFGGGTNIVGCVEARGTGEGRVVVSVDMQFMDSLVSVDEESMLATFQPGIKGPAIEEELGRYGLSLGHQPDSFEFSSLGGWIATRSAGMQSNEYGKIEDMLVSLRAVLPDGSSLRTRTVPAASSGIELNRIFLGSEGTVGIITEATMQVHRAPEKRELLGLLFRNIEDGFTALNECANARALPSIARLSDAAETELSMKMKAPSPLWKRLIQAPIKKKLIKDGYDRPCLMIVGYEGSSSFINDLRKRSMLILKKHGAFNLGPGPGKSWNEKKYSLPYLRDYLMDRGVIVDVAETASSWSKIQHLYEHVTEKTSEAMIKEAGRCYLGCHLSHMYPSGACLYFTFAFMSNSGHEEEQYTRIKSVATEAIMEASGTLSHHHAVGYEHQPWLKEELSNAGYEALKKIQYAIDPEDIFNPSKLAKQ